jgi:ATP-dependent Clp protease adapter protein ClpS
MMEDALDECWLNAAADQTAGALSVPLLNDDYTPMEFVVHVLERFFNKDQGPRIAA